VKIYCRIKVICYSKTKDVFIHLENLFVESSQNYYKGGFNYTNHDVSNHDLQDHDLKLLDDIQVIKTRWMKRIAMILVRWAMIPFLCLKMTVTTSRKRICRVSYLHKLVRIFLLNFTSTLILQTYVVCRQEFSNNSKSQFS
jgi:hypothetical protein